MRAWARNKNKSETSKTVLKGNTSNSSRGLKWKKREVEVDKNISKHHKLSPTKKCCADNILRVSRFFQYGESNYLDPSHRECDNWKHFNWNADSARAQPAQLPSHDFYDFIFICGFFNESRNLSSVGSVFNFSSFVMSPIKYYFGKHSALVGMVSRYLFPPTIPRRERSRTHQSCWRQNLKRPQ